MKILTNEVKIALVAIVGIVLLFIGMQFLKGLTIFSGTNSYFVVFDDVTGLSTSSPVYANGYKVGVVEAVDYDYNNPKRIVATIGIDPKLNVPRGSKVEIASDMLGNVRLDLEMGPNFIDVIESGDTISGALQKGMLDKAAGMIPQIEALMPKLDSILTGINTIIASQALTKSLDNVEAITGNLNVTTQQLSQLSATLNLQMPQMMTKVDGVLTNTEGVTRQLNELNVGETMQKVDATLANVESMTRTLNSREGTLGLLLHDASLYNNLNNTMYNADQLMIDLKAHPKRYVHFSVFGKKDK